MDSQLIGFRSPIFSPSDVVCTQEILDQIAELTELADSNSHVDISCLPNILSPAHAYKPSTHTFVQEMAEMSATASFTSSHSEVSEELTTRAFRGQEKEFSSKFQLHPRSKFFVIKSFSEDDVEASMKRFGLLQDWPTRDYTPHTPFWLTVMFTCFFWLTDHRGVVEQLEWRALLI